MPAESFAGDVCHACADRYDAWGVYFWRSGLPRSMGMLMQAPIYFFFIWVAMTEAPNPGYWLVIYLLLITAITWPRFPQEVIPGFLEGMKQIWRRDSRNA